MVNIGPFTFSLCVQILFLISIDILVGVVDVMSHCALSATKACLPAGIFETSISYIFFGKTLGSFFLEGMP